MADGLQCHIRRTFFQLCFYQARCPSVMGINGHGIAMKLILSVLEGYRIEETLARIILHLSKCKVKIEINKGRLCSFLFPSCHPVII